MRNTVGKKNEETRHAWVKSALKNLPPGSRILDAGAGEQRYRPFCGHLIYRSQDFAGYDGAGDSRGLQTGAWCQESLDIVCDITAIPEPDSSFDAILCTEVLEHLPDPLAALKEFSRLLKNGGTLILTAPFCSLTHFAPFHFFTGFNRYFYETHLPAHGFRIVEMQTNGNYFEYLAQELRRLSSVAMRYAGDRPGLLERYTIRAMLGMLGRFHTKDSGSWELLSYGFHVLAEKSSLSPSGESNIPYGNSKR